jgi:hypothetical protein
MSSARASVWFNFYFYFYFRLFITEHYYYIRFITIGKLTPLRHACQSEFRRNACIGQVPDDRHSIQESACHFGMGDD